MAAVRFLLDSNALSEPLRPTPSSAFLERLRVHGSEVATSSTVWNELVFGLERLAAEARRTVIERYLSDLETSGLRVLPYDREAARWHGRERARLESLGRVTSYHDGQIAAVARTRGLVLVTRNRRHFEPFDGLQTADWHDR